jgi:hypothetical protein
MWSAEICPPVLSPVRGLGQAELFVNWCETFEAAISITVSHFGIFKA